MISTAAKIKKSRMLTILISVSFRPSTSTRKFTICLRMRVTFREMTFIFVRKLWAAGLSKKVSISLANLCVVEGLMEELDPNH